ncbi:MAG: DUF2336 domain-containing protein [Sphingomonas sp.]|jgi:hypothetical protein
MSIDRDDTAEGIRVDVAKLLARAAGAESRAEKRVCAVIAQISQPTKLLIDDRTRARLSVGLSDMISAVETEIIDIATHSLTAQGRQDLAETLAGAHGSTETLLIESGLLQASDLGRELVSRVDQDMISEALPIFAPGDDAEPGLMARLATVPYGAVAALATAYVAAEANRRAGRQGRAAGRSDLPAELHHKLVWSTAAAIVESISLPDVAARTPLDQALTDAALRSVAAHDEGVRLESVALRLASAIDATPDEIPDLLVEALNDRRLPLFIAVFAHGLGIEYDLMRDIVLEPTGDRLWIAARALDLSRDIIAAIGLALCEADPRRDLEVFADRIDILAAIDTIDARVALVPMQRHPELRAAARMIGQGSGR